MRNDAVKKTGRSFKILFLLKEDRKEFQSEVKRLNSLATGRAISIKRDGEIYLVEEVESYETMFEDLLSRYKNIGKGRVEAKVERCEEKTLHISMARVILLEE